jgi:FkbM family methyltransferase
MTMQLTLDSNRLLNGIKSLQRIPELFVCVAQIENWPELIKRYLKLSSNAYPFSIKTRDRLVVNLKDFYDVTTAWVIFCKREYSVTPKHQVIVDLGANIGTFALFAIQRSPQAKVICFEPFAETFQRLEGNIQANGLSSQVVCKNVAVSGSRQSRVMATGGFGSTTSYLLEATAAVSEVDRVNCVIFDDVLAEVEKTCSTRQIDLLKIDIEGAEYEFFAEVPDELLQQVQEIQMEYHPVGDKQALFAKLAASGLICTMDWVFGENFGMAHFKRDPKGQDTGRFSR